MIDIHDEMSDIWLSSVRLFRELLSSMWTNLFDNTLLGVLLGLSILFVVLWGVGRLLHVPFVLPDFGPMVVAFSNDPEDIKAAEKEKRENARRAWDEIPARYASQQRWLGGIAILLSSMTLVLDLIFSLCA